MEISFLLHTDAGKFLSLLPFGESRDNNKGHCVKTLRRNVFNENFPNEESYLGEITGERETFSICAFVFGHRYYESWNRPEGSVGSSSRFQTLFLLRCVDVKVTGNTYICSNPWWEKTHKQAARAMRSTPWQVWHKCENLKVIFLFFCKVRFDLGFIDPDSSQHSDLYLLLLFFKKFLFLKLG